MVPGVASGVRGLAGGEGCEVTTADKLNATFNAMHARGPLLYDVLVFDGATFIFDGKNWLDYEKHKHKPFVIEVAP